MEKLIRIDVGAEGGPKVTWEAIGKYVGFGGRALTSAIVYDEVPADCHPLGPENKLVIAPGLMSGSAASTSGRLSVGCKSPLTGGIKEANAGGQAAQYLGQLNIAAIVLEGERTGSDLYKVTISKDGVKIEVDNNLKLLPNYDLCDKMKDIHGNGVCVISIGPAGERKMANSTIAVTDQEFRPTRHAKRGGVGAVMGSKGIKCIVIDPTGTTLRRPADPEKFKTANENFVKGLQHHEITGQRLPLYGTNMLTNVLNEAGGYPAFNFRQGQFDGCSDIDGAALIQLENDRGGIGSSSLGCHQGCDIKCSGTYYDKDGNYLTKQPEYETIWAHGGNCGISDLDSIARLDFLNDNYGFDSIEMGTSIGVVMDAGIIEFGDAAAAIRLVEEAGKATPMGRILGSGTAATARCFGLERAPVVKGQAMSGYDPRVVRSAGITYATSPQGADHTGSYAVAPSFFEISGDVESLSLDGQVEESRNLQIVAAILDSTGFCLFVAFAILDEQETFDAMVEIINAMYDLSMTGGDVVELGKNVLRMERKFNEKAGFTKAHDRLPKYFSREPLPPHNAVFDVSNEELDRVHAY